MGGNGSYSKWYGGVTVASRTHIDTNMRIEGHKVLLQKGSVKQNKNILNANSESPVYLIARVEKDGSVAVQSINVFKGHEISLEINLKFDEGGNYVPFNGNASTSSHAHRWKMTEQGTYERKSHDNSNVYDIPPEYKGLIYKIVEFNKKKRKWN